MSTSTDGILAYGYDLGASEEGIAFKDLDLEVESPTWWEPDSDEGFGDAAEKHLEAVAGVAFKELGVQIEVHCSGEYPMYLLAAKVITAYRGHPKEVDLTLPGNADERLAWAVQTLGLDIGEQKPRWLLASYWG